MIPVKRPSPFLVLLPLIVFLTVWAQTTVAQPTAANPLPSHSKLATAEPWQFRVTPYIWAPAIRSTLSMDSSLAQTAYFSSSDVLSNLKTGAMMSLQANQGKWGIWGDAVFSTLQHSGTVSLEGGSTQVANTVTFQQSVLSAAVTYTAWHTPSTHLDALLGARAIYATATVNAYDIGSATKSVSTIDPIIGMMGRYKIADSSWYIPFYADIGSGGGSTNLTWQAALGIGKTVNDLIDTSLTYRALYFDMKSGDLLQKTTLQGLQLSVTFKF